MKSRFQKILPKFTWIPLLAVLIFNMFTYYATQLFVSENATYYDFSISLDGMLPAVPFFIVFYVLAYVQWVFSYIYHCRESETLCYKITAADIIAKVFCVFCFVFLPMQIVRPVFENNNIFESFTSLIYSLDKPSNLFPSIHCLESWLCFRGALMMKNKNPYYIIGQGVLTILVFASTVLLKQHFIVDIPAGILVVEIGLLLSSKFGLWKLFKKICTLNRKVH